MKKCVPRNQDYLKELLVKLNKNFDNNVLALTKLINNGKDTFIFRLYSNTDELIKSTKSAKSFNEVKNYLNQQIIIGKNDNGAYYSQFGGNRNTYGETWRNESDVILNVLSHIVKPQTGEQAAIYNGCNRHGEEDFLKVFREK